MMDQMPLIDAESDDALLLSPTERRKRYTAAQAQKIEWKLDCIVTMIAATVIPQDAIAAAAHVNVRVVRQLATLFHERIGRDAMKFSEYAAGLSANFLHQASEKAAGAGFKDLMIGHGIARDTALHMRAAGAAVTDPNDGAINVDSVDAELEAFRASVKKLKPVEEKTE